MADRTYMSSPVTVRAAGSSGASDAWNAFPSIVKLKNGTLVCIFCQGINHLVPASSSDVHKFVRRTSTDGGATWSSDTVVLNDTPRDLRDCSLVVDPNNGDLLMVYYSDSLSAGNEPNTWFRRSTDGGATWGSPVALGQTETGFSTNWIASSSLLIYPRAASSYGYRLIAGLYGDVSLGPGGSAAYSRAAYSDDGGITWAPLSTIASCASTGNVQNGEAQMVRLDSTRILCVLRVQTSPNLSYWSCYSDNDGVTWSTPVQILQDYSNKPALIQTPQGDILLAGQDMVIGHHVVAYASSRDRGATWNTQQVPLVNSTWVEQGGQFVVLDPANSDGNIALCHGEQSDTNGTLGQVTFRKLTAVDYGFVYQYFTGAGDGYVRNTAGSWAASVSDSSGDSKDDTGTTMLNQTSKPDGNLIDRMFIPFDTTGINVPSNAIVAVKLNLTAKGNNSGLQGTFCIFSSTQASTASLSTSDYSAVGSTKYSNEVSWSSLPSSGPQDWILNAAGIAALNPSGYTKLAMRHSNDYNNSDPGSGWAYFIANSKEINNTNKPVLEVRYTLQQFDIEGFFFSA